MTNFWKKMIALVLAMCSLLGLCLPAVPAASAAAYQFPDTGETADLGVVLKGDLNISGLVEIADYNGRQYLGVPIKGGKFVVYALTDFLEKKPNTEGNYIHAYVESEIGIPRGIALDSKGTFYVTGDSSSVFWYSLSTGKTGQISTGSSGLTTVAVDENDNIYAVGSGGVFRIDGKTLKSEKIYTATDFTTVQGVVCGGGKVFVQGPLKNGVGTGSEVRMLSDRGELLASYRLPKTGGSYYISYIDGVVFLGAHETTEDGLVALDTAGNKLTRMDLGKTTAIRGVVNDPYQGKAYMCLVDDGTYEYDVATRTLSRKVSNTCNRPLRARNYVRNGGDMLLLSVGPSSVTTIKGPSANTVGLGGLLDGAGSTYSARSIVPGVAGTGVAVYVGAYLSGSVGSYSPNAGTPINPAVFSNGHAQTDNMIQYKDKIYAGVYSGGYLVEYDPKTNTVRELIHGLKDEYHQLRIHGLAAGDNKIFFSTIPEDQALGGCIGWYDLSNNTWYCERNVVKDQAAITLAYDEDKDILYGGTTIRGGTNTTPTAAQAALFAYDVKTKKVLASTTVGSLTGDKPRYISGIARDPDTGKFWGMVSHTLFSFAYEGGKLNVTKEWAAATTPGTPYPDGASKSWFPRPIVFDRQGGMYIGLNESKYGIMKFAIDDEGKVASATSMIGNTTRVYTLGADGDLYYYDDQLHRIEIPNQAAIVMDLIDGAKKTDVDSVITARSAYDALTQLGKNRVSSTYYNKLLALEKEADILSDDDIGKVIDVMDAIDAIGKVTLFSGPSIENARAKYNALTSAQKAKVTNVQTLLDAEKAYAALTSGELPPENGGDSDPGTTTQPGGQNPEQEVIDAINAIGTVTAASGPAIEDARYLYNSLSEADKKKVTNLQVLLDAEKAYAALTSGETTPNEGTDPTVPGGETEPTLPGGETVPTVPGGETVPTVPDAGDGELDTQIIIVQVQINTIGAVNAGSGPVIQSAREAYDALTPAQQAMVNNAQVLFDSEEAFARLSAVGDSTENDPADTGSNGIDTVTLIVIIAAAVLVLAAAAVVTVVVIKRKKKASAETGVNDAPETEEAAAEEVTEE